MGIVVDITQELAMKRGTHASRLVITDQIMQTPFYVFGEEAFPLPQEAAGGWLLDEDGEVSLA